MSVSDYTNMDMAIAPPPRAMQGVMKSSVCDLPTAAGDSTTDITQIRHWSLWLYYLQDALCCVFVQAPRPLSMLSSYYVSHVSTAAC